MSRRALVVAALVSLAAMPAPAQLCAGMASFSSGRMQVGGQLLTNDDYSSYGAALSLGTPRELFGGIAIANNDYDFIDESGLYVGFGGGYQLRPARQGFQVCPMVSLGFGLGPDDIGGTGVDMSIRQFAAGASLGMVAHRSGGLQIVPTGSLAIVNQKIALDGPGGDADESDTFLSLDLGAGFVMNSVWTIRPMLSLPLGGDGQEESLSLSVSYNFGRRAAAAPARQPAAPPRQGARRPARSR